MPTPTPAQLRQITNQQQRLMLGAFNSIIADIRDSVVLQELVFALERGNVNAALDLLQLDPATWQPMEEALREAYRTGGVTGAAQIGTVPTTTGTLAMRFNVRNPAAEQWLATNSSRMITEIVEPTRETVRQVLTQGLAQGRNPRSVALDVIGRVNRTTRRREGGFIGLTEQQAGWVSNAREELESLNPNYLNRQLRDRRLDGVVSRAIRDGKPLTAAQIDTAVTNMQNRALKYRGDTIARTESLNALRSGQADAVSQAIEQGEVDQRDVLKAWIDTGQDGSTRESHIQAGIDYAEGIPFDQPFIVGGEPLMYPGDPQGSAAETINCRCQLRTVINFGGRVRRIEGFS